MEPPHHNRGGSLKDEHPNGGAERKASVGGFQGQTLIYGGRDNPAEREVLGSWAVIEAPGA